MPDTSKDRGIVGESFKAEWMGDAKRAEHEEMMADMPPMPKGMKMPTMPPYEPPWTSLGQAPSEKQLEDHGHMGGCA